MEENNRMTESDKKWFLYVVDVQEGPFSVDEINQKIKNGEAKTSSYVWKDGLADWVLISSMPDFMSQSKSFQTKSVTVSKGSDLLGFGKNNSTHTTTSNAFGFKSKSGKTITGLQTREIRNKLSSLKSGFTLKATSNISLVKIFKAIIFLICLYQAIAAGWLDPVFEKLNLKEKIHTLNLTPIPMDPILKPVKPYLSTAKKTIIQYVPQDYKKYFIEIELPTDVPEKDSDALIQAAIEPPESGARIANALSNQNPAMPKFIIAGNIPDETKLDIIIRGKRGSLLNTFNFETTTSAEFKNKIAISKPLQSSIPKGEYSIIFYEADQQTPKASLEVAKFPQKSPPSLIPQGKRIFLVDNQFIGGIRDQQFEIELKKYNEKVNAQLNIELNEIKQMHSTIESLANESAIRFNMITKNVRANMQKKDWQKYSKHYTMMSQQLEKQVTNSVQPEQRKNQLFPNIYSQINEAFKLATTLHQSETAFFDKKTTMQDIQAKAGTTIQTLNQIKKQIETISAPTK